MVDLAEFAAPVVAQLPLDVEEEFLFTAESVPEPPTELSTTTITVGGTHALAGYPGVYYDEVAITGSRQAFRDLAVVILAALLHERDVDLHLTGPPRGDEGNRPLTRLHIEGLPPRNIVRLAARSYEYWPRPERTRFALRDARPEERPTVTWNVHWTGRPDPESDDHAAGFGEALPSITIAGLMLDLGHPASPGGRFSLEGPHGYGGVSNHSVQVKLLVGDKAWDWYD